MTDSTTGSLPARGPGDGHGPRAALAEVFGVAVGAPWPHPGAPGGEPGQRAAPAPRPESGHGAGRPASE